MRPMTSGLKDRETFRQVEGLLCPGTILYLLSSSQKHSQNVSYVSVSYGRNHITVIKRLTDGLRQTAGNIRKETKPSVLGQDESEGRNDEAVEGYGLLWETSIFFCYFSD